MYPRNLQNPNTVGRVEKLGVGNGGEGGVHREWMSGEEFRA
jgi:hypothetical protein